MAKTDEPLDFEFIKALANDEDPAENDLMFMFIEYSSNDCIKKKLPCFEEINGDQPKMYFVIQKEAAKYKVGEVFVKDGVILNVLFIKKPENTRLAEFETMIKEKYTEIINFLVYGSESESDPLMVTLPENEGLQSTGDNADGMKLGFVNSGEPKDMNANLNDILNSIDSSSVKQNLSPKSPQPPNSKTPSPTSKRTRSPTSAHSK